MPDSRIHRPARCPTRAGGAAQARLDRLWARGTAFLGTRTRDHGRRHELGQRAHLVAAISNAGGFGVIACGSMGPALLEAEIAATQALTTSRSAST